MMTVAILLLVLAVVAVVYAKTQPRSIEVFVSTHIEELPDGTTREVKSRAWSETWEERDIREQATRAHGVAMVVALGAAMTGITLGFVAYFHH